jgi:hypothetical protein
MTTSIDTDKYYTPLSIASKAFERANLSGRPVICADTACGAGSLLAAAEDVLQTTHSLGIDSDPDTIRELRRARPNWRLFVGDLLKRNRAPSTDFSDSTYGVDLLVLNPPFSLGPRKYVTIKYQGQSLKCSVAMAHILRSLDLFKPRQGAIAVVPESLLFSDTDQNARELLYQEFSIFNLFQIGICTFKGARVNSSFVQLSTTGAKPNSLPNVSTPRDVIPATIVRGSLQMHTFTRMKSGTRVIHSTTLKLIAINGISAATDKTTIAVKGRISGWMLLLPRVGTPREEAFHIFYSKDELQLSDCVIGMQFSTKLNAQNAEYRIRTNWISLVDLYRGTGARYVTVDRLLAWLGGIGIQDPHSLRHFDELTEN